MLHRFLIRYFCALLLWPGLAAASESLTVAVASNFARAAQEIALQFTVDTGNEVRISAGSTGKLFAQISNGAPYDVFLAADSERPALLESNGLGVRGSRATYAIGSLMLWSSELKFANIDCRKHLKNLGKDHLSIANPKTAPYGAAARDFLIDAGLWKLVEPRIVYGENISQALQFVASGNAGVGLIARAQYVDKRLPAATCSWPVPETSHKPLLQQAVLLQRASGNSVAAAFLEFLTSSVAQEIVLRHGYSIPR